MDRDVQPSMESVNYRSESKKAIEEPRKGEIARYILMLQVTMRASNKQKRQPTEKYFALQDVLDDFKGVRAVE